MVGAIPVKRERRRLRMSGKEEEKQPEDFSCPGRGGRNEKVGDGSHCNMFQRVKTSHRSLGLVPEPLLREQSLKCVQDVSGLFIKTNSNSMMKTEDISIRWKANKL